MVYLGYRCLVKTKPSFHFHFFVVPCTMNYKNQKKLTGILFSYLFCNQSSDETHSWPRRRSDQTDACLNAHGGCLIRQGGVACVCAHCLRSAYDIPEEGRATTALDRLWMEPTDMRVEGRVSARCSNANIGGVRLFGWKPGFRERSSRSDKTPVGNKGLKSRIRILF